MDLFFRKGN